MFDLGDYAFSILMSYAVSLVLIIGIIVQSVRRQRRIKASIQKLDQK